MLVFRRGAKSVAHIDWGGQNLKIYTNSQIYHYCFCPRGGPNSIANFDVGGHGRICPPWIRHSFSNSIFPSRNLSNNSFLHFWIILEFIFQRLGISGNGEWKHRFRIPLIVFTFRRSFWVQTKGRRHCSEPLSLRHATTANYRLRERNWSCDAVVHGRSGAC